MREDGGDRVSESGVPGGGETRCRAGGGGGGVGFGCPSVIWISIDHLEAPPDDVAVVVGWRVELEGFEWEMTRYHKYIMRVGVKVVA